MGPRAKKQSARAWDDLTLWPHQRRAIEHVLNYIASYPRNPRAALIKMPTGSGKSGVMAVLSRLVPKVGDVLVLVPWDSVADQLRRDIAERFWGHIKVDGAQLPKHVARMYPSTVDALLSRHPPGSLVMVGTIQALQMLSRERPQAFDELRARVGLVFFDEGHREPAETWSRTIREMDRPTVLFTATPYRNDHKFFNVDLQYVFNYSHDMAIAEHYIRFLKVVEEHFETEEEFVDKMLAVYAEKFPETRYHESPPHVIVRCATSVQIDRIHRMLGSRNQNSVAVHDTFPNDPQRKRFKSVAIARDAAADAVFWVHQYKLLEGFDDNRCRMLALYEPLETTRALVQQVGRILRSTNLKVRQEALLLCSADTEVAEEWNRYLAWDRSTGGSTNVMADEEMFQRIYGSLPEYTYYQGSFRERLNLKTVDLSQRMWFKRSVSMFQLREKEQTFNLGAALTSLLSQRVKDDVSIMRTHAPDPNTRIVLYMAYGSSEIFPKDFLVEYRAGYSFLRAKGRFVYFYDSMGLAPPVDVSVKCLPISPERLRGLFPNEHSRLANITLMNTDLGKTSIRRRGVSAYDLADTGVTLNDHLQVCANAVGYIDIGTRRAKDKKGRPKREKTKLRRYVGLTTGRITEDDLVDGGEYAAYIRWLESLTTSLFDAKPDPSRFFNRFADPIDVPADPTPVNILLDLEDFRQSYLFRGDEKGALEPVSVDDVCVDVTPIAEQENEGAFVLMMNGWPLKVKIVYSDQAYEIVSADLDRATVVSSAVRGRQKMTAVAFLNREQCFRVVTRTPGIIYAHNRFYQPRLKYFGAGGDEKVDLLDLLIAVPELETVVSEKGRTFKGGAGWALDTLFGTIDARGRGTNMGPYFDGFDTFVCDDLGKNEIADFIGARTTNDAPRVVLIHAKAFENARPLSASALAEVSSQATKNLHYLNPHTNAEPPNLHLWDGNWVLKGDLRVDRRIRQPLRRKAETVWKSVLATIRKPGASREVWIVLGKGLSRSRVEQGVTTSTPESQAVQIVYQLLSTWTQVASMGAALRIFCSP